VIGVVRIWGINLRMKTMIALTGFVKSATKSGVKGIKCRIVNYCPRVRFSILVSMISRKHTKGSTARETIVGAVGIWLLRRERELEREKYAQARNNIQDRR